MPPRTVRKVTKRAAPRKRATPVAVKPSMLRNIGSAFSRNITLQAGWKAWAAAMVCIGVCFGILDRGLSALGEQQKTLKVFADSVCTDVRQVYALQAADLTRRSRIESSASRLPELRPAFKHIINLRVDALKAAASAYEVTNPTVCQRDSRPVTHARVEPAHVKGANPR